MKSADKQQVKEFKHLNESYRLIIIPDITAALLLSTLVLHAAVGADVDHLHCSLLSSLLFLVLLLVLLRLLTITHRRADIGSQTNKQTLSVI